MSRRGFSVSFLLFYWCSLIPFNLPLSSHSLFLFPSVASLPPPLYIIYFPLPSFLSALNHIPFTPPLSPHSLFFFFCLSFSLLPELYISPTFPPQRSSFTLLPSPLPSSSPFHRTLQSILSFSLLHHLSPCVSISHILTPFNTNSLTFELFHSASLPLCPSLSHNIFLLPVSTSEIHLPYTVYSYS